MQKKEKSLTKIGKVQAYSKNYQSQVFYAIYIEREPLYNATNQHQNIE